ncbi:MAG: creatininase family protein [Rhodospirillaceae bacterium]|nr:creatininase family protein [Rhodospirillaceae bacterium]
MLTPYIHLTQADLPLKDAVAVIPLASMETHGPHLPLGTDGLIAEGILAHAAERITARAVSLPTLWLGASSEHCAHAGTLSCEPEHMIASIAAHGEGLARAGIKRVVLFNGHGGNIALGSIAALKLRTRFDMLAASAHWLDFGLPAGLIAPAPANPDVHGGWVETSVMLHLAPHLVKREKAKANEAKTPAASLFPTGPINWGWKSEDLAGGGWIGRPDLAQAGLGKAMVDHAATSLATLIDELAAAKWP